MGINSELEPEHQNTFYGLLVVIKAIGLILFTVMSIYGSIMAFKAIMDHNPEPSQFSFLGKKSDRVLITHDMNQNREHKELEELIIKRFDENAAAINELKRQLLSDFKSELKLMKREILDKISSVQTEIEKNELKNDIEELFKTLLEKIEVNRCKKCDR